MSNQTPESIIAAAILDYPYRPANAVAEHMISALSSAGYTIVKVPSVGGSNSRAATAELLRRVSEALAAAASDTAGERR